MRVWDVDPGYLNRQSLLGEHREIHAILSIVVNNKKGYARHPETLRWKDRLGALRHRHDLVVSEMWLRGYQHHSPIVVQEILVWPDKFVDPPGRQFAILQDKYVDRELGRIPLPITVKDLWGQHKYSILARDPKRYSQIEQVLAQSQNEIPFEQLALELGKVLRHHPIKGQLQNTLDLMWNHVSKLADWGDFDKQDSSEPWIAAIRKLAIEHQVIPLLESTALSDLHTWISASSAE